MQDHGDLFQSRLSSRTTVPDPDEPHCSKAASLESGCASQAGGLVQRIFPSRPTRNLASPFSRCCLLLHSTQVRIFAFYKVCTSMSTCFSDSREDHSMLILSTQEADCVPAQFKGHLVALASSGFFDFNDVFVPPCASTHIPGVSLLCRIGLFRACWLASLWSISSGPFLRLSLMFFFLSSRLPTFLLSHARVSSIFSLIRFPVCARPS